MKKRFSSYFLIISIITLLIISILIWRSYDPNIRLQQVMKVYNKEYNDIISEDSIPLNQLHSGRIYLLEDHFGRYLRELRKINPEKLSALHREEWKERNKFIAQQMQNLAKLRQDPSVYNIVEPLKNTLANQEMPLQSRLQQIENQLQSAKLYYRNAKTNLTTPDSAKLQPAIQQHLQTLYFLQNELIDSLRKAHPSEIQRDTFLARTIEAKIAVKDYIAFCRSLLFEYQDEALKNNKGRKKN